MANGNCLHRDRPRKKPVQLPPLAAFDIETEGLGGAFIIGALTTTDNIRLLFYSLESLFEWIVDHPGYRYLAHNASGYEFAYLYPLLYDWFTNNTDAELSPTLQGDTRVIQFTLTKPTGGVTRTGRPTKVKIDIRDTLCLFSTSLENVAKAFCPEMPKLKEVINFETERFSVDNPAHIQYVYRDCDIVLLAYARFASQLVDAFGVDPGLTAGSTSIRAFKACIPEGHVYYRINEEADRFIRMAYYGGLVLPGKTIGKRGPTGSVDVNGAYGFQMLTHAYPVGSPTATLTYEPGYQGFYHVIASVPERIYDELGFNPVPRRTEQGLDWPSGTFETYLSNFEIEYAQEKGVHFDVICGYIFTRTERVFEQFIRTCQQLELDDNGAKKPTIKILRNANYGKYATQRTHKRLLYIKGSVTEDPRNLMPFTNEENGQIIEGLYITEEESEAPYMMPHWAAMITAHERLYLMRFIEEAYRRGARNVYTDTDSLKCDLGVLLSMVADGFIPIGDLYGQFKMEEICKEFLVLGSKCFLGVLETPKGEKGIITKAKGIPSRKLAQEEEALRIYYEALEALGKPKAKKVKGKAAPTGREIRFESVKSTLSIIKENSRVRPEKRERHITDIRNSYAWKLRGEEIFPNGYLQTG